MTGSGSNVRTGGHENAALSWVRHHRYRLMAALVVIAGGLFVLASLQIARADQSGLRGKRALARAEQDINAHNTRAARADLLEARAAFQQMQHHLSGLGPIAPLARITPFVRIQIRGASDFADAGELLSNAGLHLVDAASQVLDPKDTHLRLGDALGQLRKVRDALNQGIGALDGAADKIRALDGYRLLGPLDSARRDLKTRLPRVGTRAVSARDGLNALIDMLGGGGPRRFLLLSQNPDEVRPTGGFIGTYGVLTTRNGHMVLDQYAATSDWYGPRPQAELPAALAALPLRLDTPPQAQTIANVNATADFPASGRLAASLWRAGGEQPVDGVISITPAVMARILGVLGPVTVPGYPETVTAANLATRVDFHLHFEAPPPAGRKAFLVELVHVVVQRLLDAPASKWDPLARAIGEGFQAREAMAWSHRPVIQNAVVERGWDGTLPQVAGDFFYDAEFEYSAKNGDGLHRTFDHNVVLRADGSARITTRVTIANTLPPNYGYDGTLNIDSLSFVTIYGPNGAVLGAASDPPDARPASLSSHPAAAWFEAADPRSSTTFNVAWEVPQLLVPAPDGGLEYQLKFMRLPAHNGDVLHLHVAVPAGFKWASGAPPAAVALNSDFTGAWRLVKEG
jgi:hypothetical protein